MNDKLKKLKCGSCLYQGNDPFYFPPLYPCDVCVHRPTKNKSEFVEDFTEEEKKREVAIGKFEY